jgi:hypothetical protein
MGRIKKAIHGPEYKVQADLIKFLRIRGWLVQRMAAGAFQWGVPDLYVHHPKWGARWIDVKRPGRNYTFTRAQKLTWPAWESFGVGIWILTAANQEAYDLLFAAPNWRCFWKASWTVPTQADIDRLLDEIEPF